MLLIAPVSSVIEVAAKLHCLIVTHDPDLKLEDAPWPELRTLLKDLIRINGARDVLNLATQYKAAAVKLGENPSGPNHLPQRLLALHAVELYLDALLQARGLDDEPIHNFQHDLGEPARRAGAARLVLRKRTLAHLATLSSAQEYLIVRYAPELTSTLSQVNRVMTTLKEVSRKVPKMVKATKPHK
ncbi:hypothetical protein [Ensifer adhaerens]|uniref:hypothetical protein n=1 Tax=Ensifer adhaerens TaxID=106592 RepID=UPI0020302BED|nr:hypothetical protein [Ensifer adhaerens]